MTLKSKWKELLPWYERENETLNSEEYKFPITSTYPTGVVQSRESSRASQFMKYDEQP